MKGCSCWRGYSEELDAITIWKFALGCYGTPLIGVEGILVLGQVHGNQGSFVWMHYVQLCLNHVIKYFLLR